MNYKFFVIKETKEKVLGRELPSAFGYKKWLRTTDFRWYSEGDYEPFEEEQTELDPKYDQYVQSISIDSLDKLSELCHKASYDRGWWHDPDTGEELPTEGFLGSMVIGCKLGLIHSEVSEAMEGHRKTLKDNKLEEYDALDVELVDTLIRTLDLLGKRKAPVAEIFEKKMSYNDVRLDHSLEDRKKGGKLY